MFAMPLHSQERSQRQRQQSAILLANRIPLFPQHEAMNYLDIYYESLDKCLALARKEGRQRSNICVQEAVNMVQASLEKADPNRFVRIRLNSLRRAGLAANISKYPDVNKPTLGVIGDSLTIGTMAADQLSPNVAQLLYSAARGGVGQNLTRVETYDANKEVIRLVRKPVKRLQATLTDCEECSFAYALGLDLGVPPQNMFFAAEQGMRVDTIAEQATLITEPLGHLPDSIIISYTANDICHVANADFTPQQKYEEYWKKMLPQIQTIVNNLKPSPRGTKIYIVASVDVINVLKNQKVLDKEISYYFPTELRTHATCRDMRSQTLDFSPIINNMCPYIMETNLDDEDRIAHIAALYGAIVAAQRDTVAFLQKQNSGGFEFIFMDQNLAIDFDGDDISSDCFHPSAKGHEKIADALKKQLQ